MKEKFIKAYAKKLTKKDIIKYAEKEKIIISNDELNLIYFLIQNNIDNILTNPLNVLEDNKNKLSPTTYNKLYELYTIYYPKLYP